MELETDVLKAVSRSFYLSLRFLPGPMRRPAGIAYLLARLSDTIADSASASPSERIAFLEMFSRQVNGESRAEPLPERLIAGVPDQRERTLLIRNTEILQALESLGDEEITLIREVLETIISGQTLDLERFGTATANQISTLPDDSALDDYAWRVAGCVGLFWTKLGYLTLGKNFSIHPQDELIRCGVEYGKGLQLVNILRDLPEDMKTGRCYLPIGNPEDESELLAEFSKWRTLAVDKVSNGLTYSRKLRTKRLRLASSLPGLIATETLRMMHDVSLKDLEKRIKVPKIKIYLIVLRAWLVS